MSRINIIRDLFTMTPEDKQKRLVEKREFRLKVFCSIVVVLLLVLYGIGFSGIGFHRSPKSTIPTIGQNCELQEYEGGTFYWVASGKQDFRLRICADMSIAPPTAEERNTTDTDGNPIPLFNSAGVEIIDGEDHTWAKFHGPHAEDQAIKWANEQPWVDRRDGRFDKKESQ
jgi:hypothetical protein